MASFFEIAYMPFEAATRGFAGVSWAVSTVAKRNSVEAVSLIMRKIMTFSE